MPCRSPLWRASATGLSVASAAWNSSRRPCFAPPPNSFIGASPTLHTANPERSAKIGRLKLGDEAPFGLVAAPNGVRMRNVPGGGVVAPRTIPVEEIDALICISANLGKRLPMRHLYKATLGAISVLLPSACGIARSSSERHAAAADSFL